MVWILRTLRKIEVWSHARLVATLRLPISGTKLCLQLTWAQWPWPLRQSFLLLPFNHLVGRNPMMPPVDTSHRHWPEKKRCFLSRHRFFLLDECHRIILASGKRRAMKDLWSLGLGPGCSWYTNDQWIGLITLNYPWIVVLLYDIYETGWRAQGSGPDAGWGQPWEQAASSKNSHKPEATSSSFGFPTENQAQFIVFLIAKTHKSIQKPS